MAGKTTWRLERCEPAKAADVADRRTEGLVAECERYDMPLKVALRSAYLRGCEDMARVYREHPMEQKPSVGRIVHYTPADAGNTSKPNKGQPYPAIITHVWGDTCVNLCVCADGSFPLGEPNDVPTSVNYSESGGERTWRWPPRV